MSSRPSPAISDRYTILTELGTGTMSHVYLAQDLLLGREVALKILKGEMSADPTLRERFYREARAYALLQHPHVVSVFDFGEANGHPYISMERLAGADFRQLIQDRRAIRLTTKLEAMAEVCEGLAHAHQHGIVHRDVKPSNLFLEYSGHAKIVDFGVAHLPSSMLTSTSHALGTPRYMAPEQLLSRPTDSRSDLFSAAVAFFEFLVYAHPFEGPLVMRRIVEGEPDSLLVHNEELPQALEGVLGRALAKKPEERFASASEFCEALRGVRKALDEGVH